MGHSNVDRALAAPITPPAAKLVVVLMARHAHDDTRRYWGGADYLALATGLDVRQVRRLLAGLADAGWIKPDGQYGRRRVWVLNLPLSTDGG